MNKWTAAAELASNPVSKHQMTRDGTAEPVSRDQILRHERGQGNIHFSCSADHEQDWQPYPVDPCSRYMCDHTYCRNGKPPQKSIRVSLTDTGSASDGLHLYEMGCIQF